MSSEIDTIYLIRHAESEANLLHGYINGRTNESPPTDLGIRQAQRLGSWLEGHELIPDTVLVSPAERTQQTMKHVLGVMGIDPPTRIDDRLQELDQGEWTGRLRTEVYTPEVVRRIILLGKNAAAPGGETMNEVGTRMGRAVSDLINPGTTFVFTHGLAIRCLVGQLHGWPQSRIRIDNTPNTSLTRLIRKDGRLQLDRLPNGQLWLGQTPHLTD